MRAWTALLFVLTLTAPIFAQEGEADWREAAALPLRFKAAAFDAEGRLLVLVGKQVQVYGPEGELLRAWKLPRRAAHLALDGGGQVFLGRADLDPTTWIWRQDELGAHDERSFALDLDGFAVRPDGQQAALVHEGQVSLLDLASGERRVLGAHKAKIGALVYSPRGGRLASLDHDGVLQVWDLAAGKAQGSLKHVAPTTPVFLSEDQLLSGQLERLRVWKLSEGAPSEELALQGKLRALGLSADRARLVVSLHEGTEVYQLPERKRIATLAAGGARELRVGPRGARFAALGYGKIRLFTRGPAPKPKPAKTWTGRAAGGYSSLCFDPEGAALFGAGDQLARLKGGQTEILQRSSGLWCGVSRELGPVFAHQSFLGRKPPLKLLRLTKSKLEPVLELPSQSPSAMRRFALHPRGRLLAAVTQAREDVLEAALYDLTTGRRVRSFYEGPERPTALAFDAKGNRLALGLVEATKVYDVAKGGELSSHPAGGCSGVGFRGENDQVLVAIDGVKNVAVALGDQARPLWRLRLPASPLFSGSAVFSPDGHYAAVALRGGVRLINLAEGVISANYESVQGGLDTIGLAFSPDSERLALSSKRLKQTRVVLLAAPPAYDPLELYRAPLAEARAKASELGKLLVVVLESPLDFRHQVREALQASEVKSLSESYVWSCYPLMTRGERGFEPSATARELKVEQSAKSFALVLDPASGEILGRVDSKKELPVRLAELASARGQGGGR